MNLCIKCNREFKNLAALISHEKSCVKIEQIELIRSLYKNGLLISDIKKKYGFKRPVIRSIVKDLLRNDSEVKRIAHQDPNRKKPINKFGSEQKICSNCNKSFNLGNYARHKKACLKYNNNENDEIRRLYNTGLLPQDIVAKGFGYKNVRYALKNNRRSLSESMILAHKLHAESFKHTDEAKQKMRKIRLEFYKNNPNAATSWRQKSLSYPEKLFMNLIDKYQLTQKYDIVREYSFFPYFIDFAFVNIKLAIEIDGSQHWKKQSKIDRDKQKEELLLSNSWKVYRIPEFLIKQNFEKVALDLLNYLQTFDNQPKLFTFTDKIIEYEKLKRQIKQEKMELKKEKDNLKQQQIAKRLEDVKTIGKYWGHVTELSELWQVSHSQVRRFLQKYENTGQ